jgi:hypothetical protein
VTHCRRLRRGRMPSQTHSARLGALLVALFVTTVTLGAVLWCCSLPRAAASPQPPIAKASATTSAEAPLDVALRLVGEALQTYKQVRDYGCTMISQESIKGKLQAEHVIDLKYRAQPHSVYMRWVGPKDLAGREVFYVKGQNNNKMRVRERGVAGALGFISIDPNDPRVFEHSRHTIVEAGIGHLIDRLGHWFEQERRLNKTQVRMAEYDYNNRRCIRVEAIRAERSKSYYCFRTVVYFDKENRLPIRVENYDWPRQGGPADGELLESFSFINIQFNRGINEAIFKQ